MIKRSIFWICGLSVLILGCTETRTPVVTPSPDITASTSPPTAILAPDTATGTPETDLFRSTEKPVIIITPSPSSTVTLTATPDLAVVLDGQLIILRDFNTDYLEDITTGEGLILRAEAGWVDTLQWQGNGCTLMVYLKGDGVYEINLHGEVVRRIFTYDSFPEITDGTILLPSSIHRYAYYPLSPDDSWIAYLIGSGNIEERGDDLEPFRYEYQDLATMSVDGTAGPYRLSQRGGARRVAWSPDGQRLAFSDYDTEGIPQLFVATRDGSNRDQLTHLTQPMEIGKILWSPDGERIALYVSQVDTWAIGSTLIIEMSQDAIYSYEDIRAEWWRDSDSLIAQHRTAQGQSSIIVYDISTGEISLLGELECYRMNPFGNPAMVGCLTVENRFWVYDSIDQTAELYPYFDPHWVDIQHFIAAPDTYPGEAGCNVLP